MNKLVFLGDSITDADHLWLHDGRGLGNGYVSLLAPRLEALYPDIRIWNKGQDGFTAAAVLRSLDFNCLKQKPDAVSLLVGVNDVAVAKNTGVSLDSLGFRGQLHEILKKLLDSGVQQVFCMGPFLFPMPLEFVSWFPDIKKAEDIMRKEAESFHLPFLPLHEILNQSAADLGVSTVTTDGIHLTGHGHQILSDLWLKAFCCPSGTFRS
ncbi:MAG: GDSL-type esterase/lipase family protein [Candidatus Limivivens sp.]|nr:GDSL-type esterase/lipase family protein [Candidatus Limivivens sp.]